MAVSLPAGFDFRGSTGFVTDPANCVPITSFVLYTSGAGYGFQPGGTRQTANNVSASNDPRIAGELQVANNQIARFQVDLPAPGQYTITVGAGFSSTFGGPVLAIYDNTTLLYTIDNGTVAISGGSYIDASSNIWTAAQWPGSNVPNTLTFSTSTFVLQMGDGTSARNSLISHIFIAAASSGTTFTTDSGIRVNHLVKPVPTDGLIRARTLAHLGSDQAPRLRTLVSMAGGDRLVRADHLGGSRSDLVVPTHSLVTVRGDTIAPVRTAAQLAVDSLAELRRATQVVPAELTLGLLHSLTLAPSTAPLPANRLTAVHADGSVPERWLSRAVVVTHDAYGFVRWATAMVPDAHLPAQRLARSSGDGQLVVRHLTFTADADRLIRTASLVDLSSDALVHLRNALGLVADGATPTGWLHGAIADTVPPLSWSTEGAVSGASIADASVALSWLLDVVTDTQVKVSYDATYIPTWLRGISRIMFLLSLVPPPEEPPSPPYDWSA